MLHIKLFNAIIRKFQEPFYIDCNLQILPFGPSIFLKNLLIRDRKEALADIPKEVIDEDAEEDDGSEDSKEDKAVKDEA